MGKKRRLLLVEDLKIQYETIKIQLQDSGWDIFHATDEESAMRQMKVADKEGKPIEIAVVDLGLPPSMDDPTRAGLSLVEQLRVRQENLPILAYTALSPQSVDYDLLVARLLPLRISFIYLRRVVVPPSLVDLVELVWKEYFFLAPVPADYLATAVAKNPDPLSDDLWQTLELISSDLRQKEVAAQLGTIKRDAVKSRVARIKQLLIDTGELEAYQKEKEDIIDWYKTHHIRYRRFPISLQKR